MLAKKHRLRHTRDFDQVFSGGKSAYSNILGIKTIENHLGINRFGILVSTKISKKAVVRNRIKRKIRGALKSLESKLENGYDFVILTLPPIIDADFFIICQDLDNTFKKLKING